MNENKKIILDFSGFESLHGFDEDILWHIEHGDLLPNGEFEGTLRIILEYIPDEKDNK